MIYLNDRKQLVVYVPYSHDKGYRTLRIWNIDCSSFEYMDKGRINISEISVTHINAHIITALFTISEYLLLLFTVTAREPKVKNSSDYTYELRARERRGWRHVFLSRKLCPIGCQLAWQCSFPQHSQKPDAFHSSSNTATTRVKFLQFERHSLSHILPKFRLIVKKK